MDRKEMRNSSIARGKCLTKINVEIFSNSNIALWKSSAPTTIAALLANGVGVRNLVGFLLVFGLQGVAAAEAMYQVVGVADGDTLTALSPNLERVKCRLYGIDAPEKKQAFGQASKLSLAQLSFGRSATIDIVGRDRYGRAICKIAVGGIDVNKEQITRGMAWMYRQYAKDISYSDAEGRAQARRVGIWRDNQPVPPWDFRRKGRSKT
jgi:micrococcal nuclease